MTQRMTLINSPVFVPEMKLRKNGSLATLFGNDQPLVLEIGCGIGDFIIQVADRSPDFNFLAIDIFNQGCHQTCNRIESAGLPNIRVMRTEARYLMHNYLGKESLQGIFINCPDPWPKKRHRKRRLLNQDFLNLALYCLQPGGDLHFTTDFNDYGESAGALLAAEPRLRNRHATPFTHDLGDYPISKYMRRFLEQGQPIYFCHYQKRTGLDIEKPRLHKGFRLPWPDEGAECPG